MSTLTNYNGLQIVTPNPTGPGGLAINRNFQALSTHQDTTDPTTSNDSTQGFSVGSRWYNTSTTNEWICLDNSLGAANWQVITAGILTGYLPLSGGTMTGSIDMGGSGLNGITDVGNISMASSGGTAGIDNVREITFNSSGTGITFPDSSLQSTAALPLTGGTMSGVLNMNANELANVNQIAFDTGSLEPGTDANLAPVLAFGSFGISLNGGPLNMGNAGGSGGGTIQMDAGTIANTTSIGFADSTTQSTAALPLTGGTMSGNIDMGSGTLANVNSITTVAILLTMPSLGLGGNTIYMNNNAGTGGGTINMDNGPIKGIASLTGASAGLYITDAGGVQFGCSVQTGGNDIDLQSGSLLSSGSPVRVPTGLTEVSSLTFADSTTQSTAWTNSVAPSIISGYPSDGTLYLDGSGTWTSPSAGSTPGLSSVLTTGNDAGTNPITNLGSLAMSSGYGIDSSGNADFNAMQFGASGTSFDSSGNLNMAGHSLNMYNGSGSGGGYINMDGGIITSSGNWSLDANSGTSTISMNAAQMDFGGHGLNMNNGSGSGGGTLSMDSGILLFDSVASVQGNSSGTLTFTGVSTVVGFPTPTLATVLAAGNDAGSASISNLGGITMNMGMIHTPDGVGGFGFDSTVGSGGSDIIYSASEFQMRGFNLDMNDGTGTGGQTLNMDNGVISAAQLVQLGMQSTPPTPVAGGIYFDGTHFYGCTDGSTWTVII